MFRFIKILSNNAIARSKDQASYIFIRSVSTVAQESDIQSNTTIANEEPEVKKKSAIDLVLSTAIDVPSLLKTATNGLKIDYAFKALDVLAEWSETKNISFQEIEKDKNFDKLKSVIEKSANIRHSTEIINAIRNLKKLGVPDDNFLIESLENDLLWNVRRVSVGSLLNILDFQLQHQETERQRKVVKQSLEAIEHRWTEVKTVREFCLISGLCKHFSPNFLSRIDDQIIETSENMSLVDLAKVLIAIGMRKRRPTPVLRALAFHMFKSRDILSPKQINNVTHALNALNFPDHVLLSKLSADLLPQLDEVDHPAIVGGMLSCMGQMRWRDTDLLQSLVQWVIKNINICRCSDITNLIKTLARVSYIPDNLEGMLDICAPLLNMRNVTDKSVWIDVVWSLAVLGKVTSEQVSSVLDPSFAKHFPIDDPTCVGAYLKLQNIMAAAEIYLKTRQDEKLKFLFVDNLLITHSRTDLSNSDYVKKVLHNILPRPKYLRENVRTSFGFTVDAEFVVDQYGKPLMLSEYSSGDFGDFSNSKPLPEGAHRVALMIWNYKAFTIGSHFLTGQNALAVKILNEKGYKVVEIPYFDINKRDKTVRNVQFFERKILEAIKS